jgi:subtilisin family serine protease
MATLLVEMKPGVPVRQVEAGLLRAEARLVKPYSNISRFMGTSLWLFDSPLGTPLTSLARAPGVDYLEPDEEHIYVLPGNGVQPLGPFGTRFLSLGAPADPHASTLPSIIQMIGADPALTRSRGGEGVIILVVDSGIDGNRVPASQRAGGWTDDPDGNPWTDRTGHGTMVGLIALATAPNAKLFSVKMKAGPNGGLMKESVMSAIDDLIPLIEANPDLKLVMNNSWGTEGCGSNPYW